MSANTRAIGREGEDLAAGYFVSNGFKIIERNWRCRAGEVDFIVEKGKAFYFVEVKTRQSDRFGSPLFAVHAAKQRKLRRLAEIYLASRTARFSGTEICFACLGITFKDGNAHYDWLPRAFGV